MNSNQMKKKWLEYLKELKRYKKVALADYIVQVQNYIFTMDSEADDSGGNPPGPPPPPPPPPNSLEP